MTALVRSTERRETKIPEQKQMIRKYRERVLPIADQAAKLLYDRLFEFDP